MTNTSIYQDIALRTDGDIYLGIVGPVRTGKSTFIKRFMECLVIPNIDNVYMKERAKDELPQSGSGRTIMTAEPKFVPEEAVQLEMPGGASFSVRLIDCVGYMVDGAIGQFEDGEERMVTTPWFDHEISMSEAAEIGTRKVINEHSTIGIVITTDGSITDLEREGYIEAERKVITELKELDKPFLVVVNSSDPTSASALAVRDYIMQEYGVTAITADCMTMCENEISDIIKSVLYEFSTTEVGVNLPSWVDALEMEHPIKHDVYAALLKGASEVYKIRDVDEAVAAISLEEGIENASVNEINLGNGVVTVNVELPRALFYKTLSERSGFAVNDDGDLISLLTSLSGVKEEYDKVAEALKEVRETGYGIVLPKKEELVLQEPEIVKQGGRYGVKLKASAPSIHMIMANIETEVSPGVGGERSSEDIINYLLQEFEGDSKKIWESNIFGKSLYDIAGEGLNAKIKRMPVEAQAKLRETLQRIINDGSNGLICIIL